MKNNDSKILKWAIDKIEREYKDDVALVLECVSKRIKSSNH